MSLNKNFRQILTWPVRLRKKREPPEVEKRLQDLRNIIQMGSQERRDRISGRTAGLGAGYEVPPGPSDEDLMVVFLEAQEIFNRSSEKLARSSIRLAWVLAFLTVLLVIVTSVDIVLRIFN